MLTQQINLYQPARQHTHATIGSKAAGRAGLAILATLLVIWGYDARQVGRLDEVAQVLRQRLSQQERDVAALGKLKASRQTPDRIEAQGRALSDEVRARTSALEILRTGGVGRTTGFSERLEALARRRAHGIWIDRLVMSGTLDPMSFSGGALEAVEVSRWFLSLAQEPVLSGMRFDQLEIERSKQTPSGRGPVRFKAASVAVPLAAISEERT